MWQLRIRRSISAAKVSPEEPGVTARHQAPQARVQEPEREGPTIHGCEKSAGVDSVHPVETQGGWKPRCVRKGPPAQTHPLRGTHPGLWWRDCGSGGARDTQGETELCGCRMRAGKKATRVPVSGPLQCGQQVHAMFPVSIPPSTQITTRHY